MSKLIKLYADPDGRGRKKSKGYHAEFYDANRHPTRKRLSLKTTDEQAAR